MNKKLEILFEDENYIAVNKPCGLLSVKGGGESAPNVRDVLESAGNKVFPAHRLDRDVSGCLILAKNKKSHRYINGLFEHKKIAKKYRAIVKGIFKEKKGIIDKPIKEGGRSRSFVNYNGKKAVSEFFVVKYLNGATLMELSPLTGKRHQLRVHMFFMGYPILGDRLYGDLKEQSAYPRIMLHSCNIDFTDEDGKEISIRSNLPDEFRDTLKNLE